MKILLRIEPPCSPQGRGDAHGYGEYGDGHLDGRGGGNGKGNGYGCNSDGYGNGSGHGGYLNGEGGNKPTSSAEVVLGYRSTI